ncbi:MAG: exosortase/archaeosortase family protein [Bacteroidales bacterium]|nr:exosortase/archaeosortase family protein [Bacteroidales bacterium]
MAGKKVINRKKEERLKKVQKVQEKKERTVERKRLLPLIKAFVLWIVLVLIVSIPALKDTFAKFFIDFTTKTVVLVSKLFFVPVQDLGNQLISVAGFQLNIIYECTAYNFYIFVIPLVIFSNWTIKQKFFNLFVFLLSIIFANAFRFIIMGYIGNWFPKLFESVHDYVWNIIFGLMIFIIWFLLEKRSKQSPNPQSA